MSSKRKSATRLFAELPRANERRRRDGLRAGWRRPSRRCYFRVVTSGHNIVSVLWRAALALGLAALVVFPVAAQQQQQAAPKPANIDRNGVLMLVRSTLLALDHANKTGNYTVLRDMAAPGFHAGNNAARLAEIFAKLRNDKLDLSGVAVIDPQLSLLPQIEANGMMHMAGFFPSVPSQVNFELMYAPVDGQWRLFGISVSVGQAGPVAPGPPADAKQPQANTKQPPPNPPKANPPQANPPQANPPRGDKQAPK